MADRRLGELASRRTGEAGVRSSRPDSGRGRGSRRSRCCIRSAFRSIVSSIVRRCSAVGSDAGSSSKPVSVRITVIGVRSSCAMIERKSVRIRSRSFMGTAASVQEPCSTRRCPRLERTYSAVAPPRATRTRPSDWSSPGAPPRRPAAGRRQHRRTVARDRRPSRRARRSRAPRRRAVSSRPGLKPRSEHTRGTSVRRGPRRGHRADRSVRRGGEAGPHRRSRCTGRRPRNQRSRTGARRGTRRFPRSGLRTRRR